MSIPEQEPRLTTRNDPDETPVLPLRASRAARRFNALRHDPSDTRLPDGPESVRTSSPLPRRIFTTAAVSLSVLLILAGTGMLYARHWVRTAVTSSLPQLDGSLAISGLSAPVTVQRDTHGVPHIHAATLDDLLLAQGFVTAQDRLFQMDTLRRHAAGSLAEILGPSVLGHDRLQRTLQLRASADRAIAALPPDQLHLLERYAAGVNAAIAQQSPHLPIEFRVLRYTPAPWIPRDSILVALAMFQDLTNTFPTKLARESLSARLPPDLVADLYPVGSWRDHPPTQPIPDLTIPGPPIEEIPLDESQSRLTPPNPGAPGLASETWARTTSNLITPDTILASLQPLLHPQTSEVTPGSNNWVVSGAHTTSGHPLLSNDMHLAHSLPGIWYEADLQSDATPSSAEPFHATGVSLPGLPLIVVGHNAHIAWGFTNLGADVQDIYIETTRTAGSAQQFLSADGSWQPVQILPELIKVKGRPAVHLDVLATRHGETLTPILNPVLTPSATAPGGQLRILSLRWTLYDPANLQFPFLAIDSARDWPSFLAAFAQFGGPSQNVVYADDAGHIGYHAVGRVPLRGAARPATESPDAIPADLASPVTLRDPTQSPTIAASPNPLTRTDIAAPATPAATLLSGSLSPLPLVPTAAREWSGYIPFDQLPQVFDPPGGVLASANARVTPDDYPYPITQNWAAPYRVERIYHLLGHASGLTPASMLAIQADVYSDLDHVLAQRLAYALDHSASLAATRTPQAATLHQAADLLRSFNGRMLTDSPAAAIVAATRAVLWPMLLAPHLAAPGAATVQSSRKAGVPSPAPPTSTNPPQPAATPSEADINALYTWGEKDYALEQILMHTPPRWLPSSFASWDDFLAASVDRGLAEAKAPATPAGLAKWRYGAIHVVDIENPIFEQSDALRRLLGRTTGTGPQPQSGDTSTIKQVTRSFGPSERFTADPANPDASTLNLVLGQSGNPASPWYLDQFPAWLHATTYPLPFTPAAIQAATTHTLTLTPR